MIKDKSHNYSASQAPHPKDHKGRFFEGRRVCTFADYDHEEGDLICYEGDQYVCRSGNWKATNKKC